jgi:hypothetical protein
LCGKNIRKFELELKRIDQKSKAVDSLRRLGKWKIRIIIRKIEMSKKDVSLKIKTLMSKPFLSKILVGI